MLGRRFGRTVIAVVVVAGGAVATASPALASVSITAHPPAFSNSPNASFSFTTSPAAGTECKLDSAPVFSACTSPDELSGLSEGMHTFHVQTTGGGTPSTDQYSWTVDFTPPDTALTEAPADLTNSRSAGFEFTSPDSSAGFECSLNGAAFSACTSPVTYSGLSDGTRNFVVRAVDPAGNTDVSPPSKTWTVDGTPPDTSITVGPKPLSNGPNSHFEFAATEAASFECSVDNGPLGPCAAKFDAPGLSEGTHTLRVAAIDVAGNHDPTPATRSWKLDKTPPPKPHVLIGPVTTRLNHQPGRHHVVPDPQLKKTAHFQTRRELIVQWPPGRNAANLTYDVGYTRELPGGVVDETRDLALGTKAHALHFKAKPGGDSCFHLTAYDKAGNFSGDEACTALPVRASKLDATNLTLHQGNGYYLGEYVGGAVGSLELELKSVTNTQFQEPEALVRRVALVATECPTCGKVRVRVHGITSDDHSPVNDAVETVDLHAATTKKRQLIPVHTFSDAASTTRRQFVTVATLGAKPVKIEGVGVTQY
jgi:hypothetical protein